MRVLAVAPSTHGSVMLGKEKGHDGFNCPSEKAIDPADDALRHYLLIDEKHCAQERKKTDRKQRHDELERGPCHSNEFEFSVHSKLLGCQLEQFFIHLRKR